MGHERLENFYQPYKTGKKCDLKAQNHLQQLPADFWEPSDSSRRLPWLAEPAPDACSFLGNFLAIIKQNF